MLLLLLLLTGLPDFLGNVPVLYSSASERLSHSAICVCQARIVLAAQDFVVISKPAGVPVVPTVDNVLESCLACTAQVHLLHS